MNNNTIIAFKRAILESGIDCPATILTNQDSIVRFGCEEDGGKKPCWYILSIDPATNLAHGFFGCFKRDIKKSWQNRSTQSMSSKERASMKALQERDRLRRKEELKKLHEDAAEAAIEIWDNAYDADDSHPYLQSKKVKSYGLKIGIKDELLVPLYDTKGTLHGLQFIYLDGSKYFLKGTKKKGRFYEFGNLVSDKIYICEGYATAVSIYEAYRGLVVVAFDANNLLPVAMNIRNKYKDVDVTICADNDASGIGERKAREAAKAINASFLMPIQVGYDFNDLANNGGIL